MEPFPEQLRAILSALIEKPHHISVQHLSQAHSSLSYAYAEAIQKCCQEAQITVDSLDAIGMHGQTIWHEPSSVLEVPHTLQIGSGSTLANLLGVPVVHDFRTADVTLGGQGAPLVPIFDTVFLTSDTINRIALNIGGIANATLLPRGCTPSDAILAFDTGPGNTLINRAMNRFFTMEYDANGATARSGKCIPSLLKMLQSHEYFQQGLPKSTGREVFHWSFVQDSLENIATYSHGEEFSPKDIVCTLTHLTAWSIAEHCKNHASLLLQSPCEIIVGGGGFHNSFLMELIADYFDNTVTLLATDTLGIPSDAKEAACFAYLAYRTLAYLHGNLPSVTGAKSKAILGSVSFTQHNSL
jgi:anhydro-N-acetylmuramic acid kinase